MAILFALLSALAYAAASVLQQRVAREVPEEHALRLGLLWRLIRRPMWLAGTAADWLGFGFQTAALGLGTLLLVQPLLCTGLLFALPLAAAWARRRLSRNDWFAAVALTAGLAVFLRVGELEASLPILTAVEPVIASILGVTMLGELIQASGALEWSLVAASVVVMVGSIVALARAAARVETALATT